MHLLDTVPHESAILRPLKFFMLYHCHRQFSPSSNSECWKPCTAVQVFSRYQKHRKYSANPSGPRTTCQKGSISSRSCLEANTITYPGTSKCSRLGMHLSSDGWIATWSTLPEALKACNELIKCGCKSACRRLCKRMANLPCTALHCAPAMAIAIKSYLQNATGHLLSFLF